MIIAKEKCPICGESMTLSPIIDFRTKNHCYDMIRCYAKIDGVGHDYLKYKFASSSEEYYFISGYKIVNNFGKTNISRQGEFVYSGNFTRYFKSSEEIQNFLLL